MTLHKAIQQNILILDGAMGTMLQRQGFKGNFDQLNLTHPEVVREVHRLYLEAGADILSTNTFSSQRVSQAEYHCDDKIRELNMAGVRLARELADEYTRRNPSKPRFVAGSVGPTNRTCSMSPDVDDPARRDITFDQLADAYTEQMTAMIEAGVDALLIETVFDTLNAKAALYAAEDAMARVGRHVEVMVSMTVSDKAGRTLSGQTIEAFLASIAHADIFSVGLNCSFGAKELKPFLRELSSKAPYYISCHPNAGLPNAMGTYDQTPREFAEQVMEFVGEGLVNIVGGCCGTTPDFIACLSQQLSLTSSLGEGTMKRSLPQKGEQEEATAFTLAGLEPLRLTPEVRFINIGERCNVAGSRKFLRLINEKQYDEALQIARKQVEDGAMVLDINMDDGLLDAEAEMAHFVNLIMSDPDIARIPLMIDSSDWRVIRAGLKRIQGKSIVNSLSLKEGEAAFLDKAREVKRLGAALVVMAFDEDGQATTYERKIQVCQRAYDLLLSIGFPPTDIIFDPCVLAVGTGIAEHADYALDFIRATEWIKQNLPHAHVSGGVSNLSFAFRGNNPLREAMHADFLFHNIQRGMDMAIVNPASRVTYADIPAPLLTAIDDLLLNRCPDATERLIKVASQPSPQVKGESQSLTIEGETEGATPSLSTLIERGLTENLEAAVLDELQRQGSAVSVIEGPLMDAMNRVGERFGQGKMFLPQVVKTARTMKQAVEILKPYIDKESHTEGESKTKQHVVLLATVRGDVHDIGKNIVGVVMGCNGYEIVDMGVMVSAEDIVSKAREVGAEIIGLSGLITPSLTEMVNTAHALREAGINVPLMIGGATTSDMHTALKIATEYDGPVVWMKDAAQNVVAAQHLLDAADRPAYVDALLHHQADLRDNYEHNQPKLLSLEEARKRKL
ncbi:MAG: methionine synthase [Bacteroidaceae bacterium]|nr:methionine synthase [Bacteroidaceae bacterium]